VRICLDRFEFRFGHAGVMLERHGYELAAAGRPAHETRERDDGTDVSPALCQNFDLGCYVEIIRLNADCHCVSLP
jgi:hypothetical protein